MSIQETMDDFLEMIKRADKGMSASYGTFHYLLRQHTGIPQVKRMENNTTHGHYRGYSCHVAAGFRCPAASVHLSGEGK